MDKSEQQVWQRVFERRGEVRQPVSQLGESLELSAAYRQLLGKLTGKERELARRLLEEEQLQTACLRGLERLAGREPETVKLWNPAEGSARKLLEKCWHRTRRCLVEYTARSPEGEPGVVYRQMADRAAEQCQRLAALLGMVK